MSKLLKSQNYLMKCLGFVLIFGFIAMGAIGGCSNNGGGGSSQDTQALTENDFFNDPNLSANPKKGVVVIFVEHPDSKKPDNDTGEVGSDIIPYRYTRTFNHTYCFEDENVDAEHFAILFDSEGNEVLRVEANGKCVTEIIGPGDYFLVITHDGKIEEILPLFAIPQQNGEQAAQRGDTDQGLFKSAKSQFSKILNNFHKIITPKAKAQTVAENVQTLLSSNSCIRCNLAGANLATVSLRLANLTSANLTGANLSESLLIGVELAGANLTGANLSGTFLETVGMVSATLTDANLTGAQILGAHLNGSVLIRADLSGALLFETDLSGAILFEAILFEAILSFTDLGGAIWCDGCICALNSIDVCVGCASIDTCVGPPPP